MRILLVEDDKLLGDGIRTGLQQDGFAVDWVGDGIEAGHALGTDQFDLLILDIGLPGRNGLEVLQNLRSTGNTIPTLILTARDALQDRISGLDKGADDYMIKPFDLEELSARLRALLRRSKGRASPQLQLGDLILDPAAHQVFYQNREVELSPKEFALLEALLANAGRVVSKYRLQETVYSWDEDLSSNALEVHIHHLRKKLETRLIRTVRGVGYMIEKPK